MSNDAAGDAAGGDGAVLTPNDQSFFATSRTLTLGRDRAK